jgi:hypothetical protein
MAAPLLPQDVSEYLQAAIQLSNRRVHLRFLEEAELLLTVNLPAGAVLVAGVVLEAILAGSQEPAGSGVRERLGKWTDLRDGVANSQTPAVSLDQAREMVRDVRESLTGETPGGPRPGKPQAPPQVRGKFRFVPTSAAEFISRKADELRLEHDDLSH